jgi:hypothetical protein
MRLMAIRSSVSDDLALLGARCTMSSGVLDSIGPISKECAMVTCGQQQRLLADAGRADKRRRVRGAEEEEVMRR